VNVVVSKGKVETDLPVYVSVQLAIDAAPKNENNWRIAIFAGEYRERVEIERANVSLIGAGTENTRIVFGRYAGQKVSAGSDETWGTFRTATLEVNAKDVSISHLTIENSFDYPANELLDKGDQDKVGGQQAVALKVSEFADRSVFSNIRLLGYQDTLYVQGGRSYFKGGEIHGHVDFIFGNGDALFDGVDIISRARMQPKKITGFITAPSTLIDNEYGLTFIGCRLLREDGVPDNSVPLGRPWHPTTTFPYGRYANPFAVGKSVFIDTFMDAHITTNGWTTMGGTQKDGTRKQFDPLTEARFFEYKSFGPGAHINQQRPQLDKQQVKNYDLHKMTARWGVHSQAVGIIK
jgi:pectinesterase